MADIPLPEPFSDMKYCRPSGMFGRLAGYTADQMHSHAAAQSAADNAALRAELATHQESEFHPDWSMLAATRDSLAEHQQIIRDLRERVNVLEDALKKIAQSSPHEDGCYYTNRGNIIAARAALGDTPC